MEQLEALHDAVEAWNDVLLECFDGLITLTDVTDPTLRSPPYAHADLCRTDTLKISQFVIYGKTAKYL